MNTPLRAGEFTRSVFDELKDQTPNTRARALSEFRRGQSATTSQKDFERKHEVTQQCCGFKCTTNTKILVYALSVFGLVLATGILVFELLHQAPCGCCGWDLTFATSLVMFIFGFWMPSPGD